MDAMLGILHIYLGLVLRVLCHLQIFLCESAAGVQKLRPIQGLSRQALVNHSFLIVRERTRQIGAVDGEQDLTLCYRVAKSHPQIDNPPRTLRGYVDGAIYVWGDAAVGG